jgi:hypothetical protein
LPISPYFHALKPLLELVRAQSAASQLLLKVSKAKVFRFVAHLLV